MNENTEEPLESTLKKVKILEKPAPGVEFKEFVHLPVIEISESDEKFLFDIGVQLKFSDPQV